MFVMGNRYRVHYKLEGQNLPRSLVADFMYEEDGSIYFSGRAGIADSFGTTSIPVESVIDVLQVTYAEPIQRPKVLRPPVIPPVDLQHDWRRKD
jgi:hypothetical protein